MKLKMKALSLAVATIAAGTAAHAADVVMFPYVVNSPSVTTIVTVVDRGVAATARYNSGGVIGNTAGFNRLHWRLNYKADAAASNNTASCQEVNYYLPSSPNDIQTVDLGGKFASTNRGVMFSDPSTNNNWRAGTDDTINYMLGKAAGVTQRGVLFVHNADALAGTPTVYGEAMVLEFASGASWGYQAVVRDSAAVNDETNFAFAGSQFGPTGVLTFMPAAEVTTRLFVTPTASATPLAPAGAAAPILAANGASNTNWERWTTVASLTANAGGGAGVGFNRDEVLVSGALPANITCVGAVEAQDLMTSGARTSLANGGWSSVVLSMPVDQVAFPAGTDRGVVTKLEFRKEGATTFNGEALGNSSTFNNGFIMQ